MRNIILNKKICDNLSTIGSSDTVAVYSADDLSVSITFSNDSSDVKISFWGSLDNMNWHAIEGTSINDGSTYMLSTTEPQLYFFDVSMCAYFKITLDTISSGNISAYVTTFNS